MNYTKFPWQKISMHPRLAAALELVLAMVFWWWLIQLTVFWALFIWGACRIIVLALLTRLCYYPPQWKRLRHFFVLCLFNFGLLLYLLFVEWSYAAQISGAIFIALPALSFFLLPHTSAQALLAFKPQRRVRLAMTILGLSGVWVGIYSSIILQIFNINFWLWLFLGALVCAFTAYFWWQEYEINAVSKMRLWAFALLVMILELAWVLYLMPLGYFVSGFLIVWFWYGLWILARFYLTPVGINWKKQGFFLAVNGGLLILFLLFVARWR